MPFLTRLILITALIALIPMYGYAKETESPNEQPMTLKQLQQIDNMNKSFEDIQKLKRLANAMYQQKVMDCMKAFGNMKFCKCIGNLSPMAISFSGYIDIIISSKKDLHYGKLNKQSRDLIDKTIQSRDMCVKQTQ